MKKPVKKKPIKKNALKVAKRALVSTIDPDVRDPDERKPFAPGIKMVVTDGIPEAGGESLIAKDVTIRFVWGPHGYADVSLLDDGINVQTSSAMSVTPRHCNSVDVQVAK
jgi:hypothetical protein